MKERTIGFLRFSPDAVFSLKLSLLCSFSRSFSSEAFNRCNFVPFSRRVSSSPCHQKRSFRLDLDARLVSSPRISCKNTFFRRVFSSTLTRLLTEAVYNGDVLYLRHLIVNSAVYTVG